MTAAGTRTELPVEPAERGSGWGWKLRVLALVLVFALITLTRSHLVDIPIKDPHGKLFTHKILSTAEMLLVFVAVLSIGDAAYDDGKQNQSDEESEVPKPISG